MRFFVPGLPIAQPRQRHAVIAGHVRNYVPRDNPVHEFKARVRTAFKDERGTMIEGPVMLSCEFTFPRTQAQLKPKAPRKAFPHAKRPDLDNLLKSVMDALKAIAWRDDAQVFQIVVSKNIQAIGEPVGVMVGISEWTDCSTCSS